MIILGIAFAAHNSSAALLEDGKLTYFIEEERLNRIKNSGGFPILSIKKCLEERGLSWSEIDAIAYFRKPWLEAIGNLSHFIKFFPQTLKFLNYSPDQKEETFLRRLATGDGAKNILRKEFGSVPKFYFIEHHLAHAASTYYGSGFEHAAILSLDGRGESITTLIAEGKNHKIKKIRQVKVPHSIGHLYAAITNYLGFHSFNDEWKVMGMSAYGDNTYVDQFLNLIKFTEKNIFELDLSYFSFHTEGQRKWLSPKFYDQYGPARLPNEPLEKKHYDIAHALQITTEKLSIHLAKLAHQLTGSQNLCLAGGVALNCVMNSAILRETPFKNIFVQPIANDAGTAYGSALYLYHSLLNYQKRENFDSVYLGPKFSIAHINRALSNCNIPFIEHSNPSKEIAKALMANKIVGVFHGRMEAGPRALGNRSILANPCDANIRDILNLKIKKRENFRPLAPVVLEDKCEDYFELPKNSLSPHMTLTAFVKKEKIIKIPAVTHADGTARVQTVNQKTNPLLFEILNEFEKLSGVPVLLNTSFNENEPIVCTPEEAIECFQRTKMDLLCLENILVSRQP